MENKPYNAADKEQIKDRKLDEKAYRKQLSDDLGKLLDLPEGKRYFWYLLSKCGMFGSSFALPSEVMYAKEGTRSVATELWTEMEAANKEALLFMLAHHGNQQ